MRWWGDTAIWALALVLAVLGFFLIMSGLCQVGAAFAPVTR